MLDPDLPRGKAAKQACLNHLLGLLAQHGSPLSGEQLKKFLQDWGINNEREGGR